MKNIINYTTMTHKSLMMAVILATASATSFAQGPESGTQPAVETATQVGDQFHQMEYKGFLFDIPEESRVVIDRNMVARMPDGTFGVSMTVEDAPAQTRNVPRIFAKDSPTNLS